MRTRCTGDFYEPTVLVDVDHSMLCMTEETFGPTLPVMKVRDAEEAIELANDCIYGLNSSVFTRDRARGERLARRIEAGSACVNDALSNYLELRAPFAGWKDSGLGGRHGAEGIRKYCKTQSVLVTRFAVKQDPMRYPRTPAKTKAPRADADAPLRPGPAYEEGVPSGGRRDAALVGAAGRAALRRRPPYARQRPDWASPGTTTDR